MAKSPIPQFLKSNDEKKPVGNLEPKHPGTIAIEIVPQALAVICGKGDWSEFTC